MTQLTLNINAQIIKRLIPVLGVALLLIGLGWGEEAARELLRYQRDKILDGEWWRLISGHLVHLGWSHLWLNLLGWVLIAWLFGPDYRWKQWLWIAGAGILTIGAGFLILDPQLEWYVGLSGLLHTAMIAGVLAWVKEGDRIAVVALLILVAKLVWEQVAGPVPMTAEAAGGPVVVNAHLYGAIGGAVSAIIILFHKRKEVSQ